MEINLDKTLKAMSIALYLSEISSIKDKEVNIIEKVSNINYSKHKFTNHSKRTTYIALKVAKLLNLKNEKLNTLYISSLFHDIGAANALLYSHIEDDFIKKHCIVGANILNDFPFFKNMSKIILYHHENYDGTGPLKLKGEDIPIESQIIRISDLVELLYNEEIPPYKQRKYITDWTKLNSEIIFSKNILDAFLEISYNDIFWFDLENMSFLDSILDSVSPNLNIYLSLDEFESIANIFSNIIDAKSKFTAKHSRGISKIAYKISKYLNYPEKKCKKMKIAGLLHDIGKLAIPSKILDKKGPLTSDEFSIIKSHAYYTSIILNKIEGIEDISEWASNHHEKLNGKGYPRGLTSEDLKEESRILAVCDIYQSLIEDRPYRKSLDRDKAFSILHKMADENLICTRALNHLKNALKN